MIVSIIVMAVFGAGLAYMVFPGYLTYKNMKAAAVVMYHYFQKKA